MGGLSVLNAGFLAAGAAFVAVPVLIHLLFRRKAVRVDLGSLRFLKVALQDNARRRKVRRWLLLASRVLGALLLGLLFARPYRFVPSAPGMEREVAILIDRSASMGIGDPSRSAFLKAKVEARRLVDSLPDGTSVQVAFFDASGVNPVPTNDFDWMVKAPSLAGTDTAKGLDWARDRMVESSRKFKEVYLYTDLQRLGLDPSPRFSQGVTVEVVDVGRPITANLAVEDARAIRTEVRDQEAPLIMARVRNLGSFPSRDVVVHLNLTGPRAGQEFKLSETITIDGLATREVRFVPTIREAGLYRGTVELAQGDEASYDDRRFLAFEARVPERILLVDGEAGSTVYANETYYLEAALRLRVPGAGPSATPFEPLRIAWDDRSGSSAGAGWPDLSETRVVVLANVAEVPEGVASSLRSFVDRGGSLLIFSGGRVAKGAYDLLKQSGMLPAEVESTIKGPLRFETWEADHPLLRPFHDPQHGDLRALMFQKVSGLKPTPGSLILASSRADLPLLVERKVGRGRVLQCAIAADNEWGDWAVQRLYLPLVHQMIGYLCDRLPGAGPVQSQVSSSALAPGVEPVPGGLIVRNLDPSESTIDRVTIEEFRSSLGLPELSVVDPSKAKEAGAVPVIAGAERLGEFWRTVAWALLVVLVVETFLANRTHA